MGSMAAEIPFSEIGRQRVVREEDCLRTFSLSSHDLLRAKNIFEPNRIWRNPMNNRLFRRIVLGTSLAMSVGFITSSLTKTAFADDSGYRGCQDGTPCATGGGSSAGGCAFTPNGGSGYCGCVSYITGVSTGTYGCAGGSVVPPDQP